MEKRRIAVIRAMKIPTDNQYYAQVCAGLARSKQAVTYQE
jgi:hypothetical protein